MLVILRCFLTSFMRLCGYTVFCSCRNKKTIKLLTTKQIENQWKRYSLVAGNSLFCASCLSCYHSCKNRKLKFHSADQIVLKCPQELCSCRAINSKYRLVCSNRKMARLPSVILEIVCSKVR